MSSAIFTWLLQSSLASTVILACAVLAARTCRQPVDRVQIFRWAMIVTFMATLLTAWPGFRAASLGIVDVSRMATSSRLEIDENQIRPESLSTREPASHSDVANVDRPRPNQPLTEFKIEGNAEVVRPEDIRGTDWFGLTVGVVATLYVMGAAAMALLWGFACWRLRQLRRNARQAPADLQRQLANIAGANRYKTTLLESSEVDAPIMWGLHRPVIVLPSESATANAKLLKYAIAHEWAHVVHRDYATWQLAALLQILLYYHPLYWRLRRDLGVSMDQLADAAAAEYGSSKHDYAKCLLELARRRMLPTPQTSLGFSGKGSPLRERISFILETSMPPHFSCSKTRSMLIGSIAIILSLVASAVRLHADPQPIHEVNQSDPTPITSPPATSEKSAEIAASKSESPDSITYVGVVTDLVTGMPISGVKVSVIRRNSRERYRILETTDHDTNALGVYSFVVPPEQVAEPALYLEVEAHHPDYAAKGRSGYSHAMIRKNLELGELPFYTKIGLWPGEAITGTIVSPDGAPLSGVEVSMYSASDQATGFPKGSFDKTTSDDQGQFRIVPPTPGDGVLWIKPDGFSPQAHRIGERRGDWGQLKMEEGPTIPGRVLDVNGEPVAGVRIESRRRGDGEQADDYLNNNAVANQIGREVVSDASGNFTLKSLPDGDYEIRVASAEEGYNPPPLPHVFLRQKMTIANGVGPEFLEIRATPHVLIQATYVDSTGKPRSGHEVHLFGRMDGEFYAEQSSTPRDDGKLEIRVPHGLQDVTLNLITNEHSALRWRMGADQPLRRGSDLKLGTVEDDVSGIEIMRYKAPILLVKAVDEEGQPLGDWKPVLEYTRPDGEGEQMTMFTAGGHVSFEHQQDGRWRSSQLLPDEPAKISVEKEGYVAEKQEISLPEGAEHELVFALRKSSAAESTDTTSSESKSKTVP
jgi:beta-lactamase regulating signal transducer with metallopeptidase domain/5-hydroxyisourate hydrolase-like protein (transthyretin family)